MKNKYSPKNPEQHYDGVSDDADINFSDNPSDLSWKNIDLEETILSLFEKNALEQPSRTAVIFKDQSLSYQQLDERSRAMSDWLIENGLRKGEYVPIYLDRSVEWVIAVLAILKSGAAYVPIDPMYPKKRVEYILKDCSAKLIISQTSLWNDAEILNGSVRVLYVDKTNMKASCIFNRPAVFPADTAYMIYTSGSTGEPKGVVVGHLSIQHLVTWHNSVYEVTANSRLTLVAGFTFDISVWETWSALVAGAMLIIADHDDRTDAAALIEFYVSNGITHAFAATVLVPEVVSLSRNKVLPDLKYLFTGGEQLKPVLTDGLSYSLIDYYGPTEYTVYATHRRVKDADGQFVSTIGMPIANTGIYLLDQDLRPVEHGNTGELCLGGIGLAKGYHNNEELTAAKFIENPFEPGKRIYRTGDLARILPGGNIAFLGRIDKQVKIRGFRVELGEIESAIMRNEKVRKTAVIVRENSRQQNQLIAFVVANNSQDIFLFSTLRQQLKEDLPAYMIPAMFYQIDELPITINGKIDKAKLEAVLINFKEEAPEIEDERSSTANIISKVWQNFLERPYILNNDNFFDIGGDSLLVAIVTTELQKHFKTKVYMRDLYQYPTLESYASIIDNRLASGETAVAIEDVEPYIALQKDVYLPEDFSFKRRFDGSTLVNQQSVLLTGSTGFVGIHLLQELLVSTNAKVYCLVRATDDYHAREKIMQTFAAYNLEIHPLYKSRIIPITGDFSENCLGISPGLYTELANEIEVIYHSGSSVNFIEPYSYMKKPNVEGLREILSFAAEGKPKCLSLMSTISVYSWGHVFTHKKIMNEADDINQNILSVSKDIGYVRSKWVMEAIADLAAAHGVPVITFRLGYAMCNSQTGASAPYQWWAGLVKNCMEYGSYPALHELREGLITVDYIAKAVVHITKNKDAIGLKFNLIASPETNLTLEQFFVRLNDLYNFGLCKMPYKDWRHQWEGDTSNRLYPLTSLFRDNMHEGQSTVELYQDTYIWHRQNTDSFLKGSTIEEPTFDKTLLDRYLNFLGIHTIPSKI